LWNHVKKVNEAEGVTVFLTTHYMDEADRVAHRIGVIDHGKLVAQGTPSAIKEQTGTVTLEDAFLASPAQQFATRARVPLTRCGNSRACGVEANDERYYILWLRELKRYTRSRSQIVASLGQPLLYLLVLGFGLGPVFKRAGYGSYFSSSRLA